MCENIISQTLNSCTFFMFSPLKLSSFSSPAHQPCISATGWRFCKHLCVSVIKIVLLHLSCTVCCVEVCLFLAGLKNNTVTKTQLDLFIFITATLLRTDCSFDTTWFPSQSTSVFLCYALLVTAICQHIIIKDKLIQPNRSSRKLFMSSMNVNMCAYAVHKQCWRKTI